MNGLNPGGARCPQRANSTAESSKRVGDNALHPSGGFTLLEILLAMALAGLVLVSLNTFIFSMGELWGRNAEQRLFDQHVRAVTRFLQRAVIEATLPPSAAANATPVAPQQITPLSGIPDNLITFELPEGSPIFNWPDRPLPEVLCSLQERDDGLYLLWQSRLETTFGTAPPRELRLTPYVTALTFDYFDSNLNRWANYPLLQTDPTSGLLEVPGRLRLTFTYGKLTRTSVITIPAAVQALPLY